MFPASVFLGGNEEAPGPATGGTVDAVDDVVREPKREPVVAAP